MYNLLNYSKNFRKTAGSFWNYYPDESNSGYYYRADTPNNRIIRERAFHLIYNSESFDYKTKLVGTLQGAADDPSIDVETELGDIKIIVPLKNLSSFIFNLNFLMINTEIELILKWSQHCVLIEKLTRNALPTGDDPAALPAVNAIDRPKDLKFNITDCKLYVPVVTLQEKYENKL